jgi:hypothetical protein
MTYTATCPDPSCKTTFEVDEEDLELEVGQEGDDDGEPIQCPTCEKWWDFDFDEDREPKLKLTEEVDMGDLDPDDEDDNLADGDIEDDE